MTILSFLFLFVQNFVQPQLLCAFGVYVLNGKMGRGGNTGRILHVLLHALLGGEGHVEGESRIT